MRRRWMLVAGDLTPLGGMDRANHALARYLATAGDEVHVVAHRVWPDLTALPNVTVHRVWRPLDRHALGSPLLAREGRRSWHGLRALGARAVVNGGNCLVPDANWVHYLHAAYASPTAGSPMRRVKAALAHQRDVRAERAAVSKASVVICNSRRTRDDVLAHIGVPESRVHVVYYGNDQTVAPVQDADREQAKRALGLDGRLLVGFVGALGDRRKGFDALFDAWTALCARPAWEAALVVLGTDAELPAWRARAEAAGLAGRFRFLGFREDVPAVLAALDGLVHPARYEAYGLAVHEAVCCGVPALVSRAAGVAERYPPALADLLIDNPDDRHELIDRLTLWQQELARLRPLVAAFSATLRSHTWDAMAQQIVSRVERAG